MYASSRQLSDVPGARVDRRWLVGKSARRVARRILSRSNVRSGSLGPGLRFMPLPIIRLLRDYYSEDLLDTFAPFLSFFFFSRVPLVSLDVFSVSSVLKIRTKINWFRSLFFNFQRANGCSWKIYDEHLRFGFIRALELTSTIVEDGFHRYAFLALPQVKPSYE